MRVGTRILYCRAVHESGPCVRELGVGVESVGCMWAHHVSHTGTLAGKRPGYRAKGMNTFAGLQFPFLSTRTGEHKKQYGLIWTWLQSTLVWVWTGSGVCQTEPGCSTQLWMLDGLG